MAGAVIVHNPDHARAVCDATARYGVALCAVIAEWAGVAHGALYWAKAVKQARTGKPDADVMFVLHCGDDAARAQGVLREGWKHICFTGNTALAAKIASIAAQHGASVCPEPDDAALDLGASADPPVVLAAWIVERQRCK